VQHPALVRVREPLRHLLGDAQCLGPGDRPFRDALGKGPSPEEFHHEVGTRRTRSHIVQRHDARVVEARHRLGLLLDPVRGQFATRPGQAKRLHGDDPVQLRVERLVDRAEASAPHLAPDLEPANAIPGLKLPLPGVEKVLARGLEDFLEESGERAGLTGARLDHAVALFLALRQGEPPGVVPRRLAGSHRGCHRGLPESRRTRNRSRPGRCGRHLHRSFSSRARGAPPPGPEESPRPPARDEEVPGPGEADTCQANDPDRSFPWGGRRSTLLAEGGDPWTLGARTTVGYLVARF